MSRSTADTPHSPGWHNGFLLAGKGAAPLLLQQKDQHLSLKKGKTVFVCARGGGLWWSTGGKNKQGLIKFQQLLLFLKGTISPSLFSKKEMYEVVWKHPQALATGVLC